MTAAERTRNLFNTREQRDLLFASLIGATVLAIIATSAVHFIRSEPAGLGRLVIGGVSGGIGGVIGLFIISEVVNQKWLAAVMLSVTVGVLDGLLVGAAVALFPSIF